MSRHLLHVATSFLPTVGFPGRDAKLQVATSHAATHVATSKMMSRHPIYSAPFLLRRDAKRCRDLALAASHVATSTDVATSTPTCCYSARSRRPFPCRDVPCCYPHRDLIMMSRHQFQLAIPRRDLNLMSRRQPLLIQVATPTGRRDTNPSSFCKENFFFFSPVASLLLLGPSSPYKTCYPLDDAVA